MGRPGDQYRQGHRSVMQARKYFSRTLIEQVFSQFHTQRDGVLSGSAHLGP